MIADYNPLAAASYAEHHTRAIKGDRAHIMASVVSDSKDGQAVGVACFGDLHENLDKGVVCKIFFPFREGSDVATRELAAIRHAFQEGAFQVEDREAGIDDGQDGIKVKTFTAVTTSIEAIRRIRAYSSVRTLRQAELCYEEGTLLQDIVELSSELAERNVAPCIYYAPENATGPLQLAGVNASFGKELCKVINQRQQVHHYS
jgi:hypothetical protein